ncbi:putative peptidase S49, ClpP/crotonase-like domain-containing protein [Rosa chinensis]|uniref:Putative peptidase S49, ClpP/crotonase-like domain-containing protein n=1 Tax=Rosa chinensis TaxID=74649 RepID=A0A2P6RH79_ROSCH|nr:putative peptidase S49, ClpP/crotonase-like domain-containing protein [Rosa chinensis]
MRFFFPGVLEKTGVEPQVKRIGKYESFGEQLAHMTMSEENCEMLTALLDNIYGNWLDIISSTRVDVKVIRGVVEAFNLGKLYEKIGFNKEIISRGNLQRFLTRQLFPARSMTVDKMEEVAQGRVWAGKYTTSRGLVDAIGGLSRAVAIAKLKANIPQDREVGYTSGTCKTIPFTARTFMWRGEYSGGSCFPRMAKKFNG